MTTQSEAAARLQSMIDNDLVLRGTWVRKDEDGRERACLLAALVPQCGINATSTACPAEILPAWLARITPALDDNGSLAAWPSMIREYACLVAASGVMTSDAWRRLDYRARKIACVEARAFAGTLHGVPEAIDGVIAVLDREIGGETVPQELWSAANSAADSAANSAGYYAGYYAADSAAGAARAANSAAYSAASAARSAARSAAYSAANSAGYYAANSAAYSAAYDRMTTALFVEWQNEIASLSA